MSSCSSSVLPVGRPARPENGSLRNQNFSCSTASLRCALLMFSSTFEMGMYKFNPKLRIARVTKTTKIENAAFSRSEIWTSIDRNSTRHPIGELCGGGLKRTVCQLVDWMFWKSAKNEMKKQ
ncbi:MAG: hypothetical protein BJ554DRAFT_2758 [Olpidium bornovanus]|uniref:Uncharacterized protein n=1 Tax=Olpidium bornovanus TaxID=278681 RepID=A0A8H7ZQ04_9FUNG|nr:MAG: hypothetical protein BJ554DRAFT_2758 [Olpidium bornovanus]